MNVWQNLCGLAYNNQAFTILAMFFSTVSFLPLFRPADWLLIFQECRFFLFFPQLGAVRKKKRCFLVLRKGHRGIEGSMIAFPKCKVELCRVNSSKFCKPLCISIRVASFFLCPFFKVSKEICKHHGPWLVSIFFPLSLCWHFWWSAGAGKCNCHT